MTVIYNTPTINARLSAVVGQIDAGPGNGVLKIGTSGMASILSNIVLAKPSGTVAAGVLTFSGLPLAGSTLATGTAASAQITDSNGTVVVSGLTIGLIPPADLIMSEVALDPSRTCDLIVATITGR